MTLSASRKGWRRLNFLDVAEIILVPGQRAIAIIFLQNKNMSRQYKVTGIRLEAVVGIATSILLRKVQEPVQITLPLELPKSRIRPTGPRLPKVGTRFLPGKGSGMEDG